MDAIALIVTALSAGAGSAVQDGAAAALKEAYRKLSKKARTLLSSQPNGELVLNEHERNPVIWKAPLTEALSAAGAAGDAELIEAAQALLALTDAAGSSQGKYIVHASGNQGIQIGDGNNQANTFSNE
jgi:hypothetical protein